MSEDRSTYVTWPMETTLTPAALSHVETAIRNYVREHMPNTATAVELHNAANDIASLLQHHIAERKAASVPAIFDPLLA